jgi:hypothetical protein
VSKREKIKKIVERTIHRDCKGAFTCAKQPHFAFSDVQNLTGGMLNFKRANNGH